MGTVNAAGGLSEDHNVCKQYAMRDREDQGPPAVYYASAREYVEQVPQLQPVQYNKEWLEAHPEVATVCQTIPSLRTPMEDEIRCVLGYSTEKEWVVIGQDFLPVLNSSTYTEYGTYKNKGSVMVLMTDKEMERLGLRTHDKMSIEQVDEKLDEAKHLLEKTIPEDLLVDRFSLYYCPEHMSVVNANTSGMKDEYRRCYLHSYLEPKGGEYKKGFERPMTYNVW